MPRQPNRRHTLLGALALGVAGLVPRGALASETVQDRLAAFAGGATPQDGRIRLDLPEVAENGGAVTLSVGVDSPMTADDHVAEVLILAHANPRPMVASFAFTALSGRAEVVTRIRLADSQTVTAVARMSDGRLFKASRDVIVTVGGCAG